MWQTAQPYLRKWRRERMSPRAVLRQVRKQLPDVLVALQAVPQIFQTAVRDATEGRLRVPVENLGAAQLREQQRRSDLRRDMTLAAAVLWVSGLVWLAFSAQIPWLGWVQMTAAIAHCSSARGSRGRAAYLSVPTDSATSHCGREFSVESAGARGFCRRRIGRRGALAVACSPVSPASAALHLVRRAREFPSGRCRIDGLGRCGLVLYALCWAHPPGLPLARKRHHRGRTAALAKPIPSS